MSDSGRWRSDMRQHVVIIATADLDETVLAWAALVGDQLVCVMSPKGLNSPLHRRAAEEMISRLTKNMDIDPEWPWDSDPITEG
jgi:hypothetical protein